ncbi:MAG: hypothetical protein JJU11_03625 [Candidatus Sumerlaeia bacterium]|nr:hypothetical protein [Candidatus Sumerlaeia bacterium]
MSHSSTSNSERDWDVMPEVAAPLLRWGIVLVVLFLAEFGLRMAMNLTIIEEPVLYRNESIDGKVRTFVEDFVPERLPGTRVLIVGSSIAATNIDPETMTREMEEVAGGEYVAYNLGMYGARFPDHKFVANWAHNRWPYDKLVIVLEPWSFRYGEMGVRDRMGKLRHEDWLMRNSALFSLRSQIEFWDENRDNRLRGIIDLDNRPTLFGWNRTIHPPPFQEIPEELAEINARAIINFGEDPPKPFQPDLELPIALRDWANKRGIPVYWVLSPQRPELEQFMPEEYTHEARREMARILADARNNYLLDLIDMETSGRITTDHFFDSTHLNGLGALILSEELGRRFGRLLLEDM